MVHHFNGGIAIGINPILAISSTGIGFCASPFAILAGDGRFIHIMGDVMVLPEFQGRGVGKKLIEALGDWLKKNGAKNAFVCLFASENQAGYYRQFGFSGPESGFVGMSKVLIENDPS